jgi:pilus assembly protein Flp/PilA
MKLMKRLWKEEEGQGMTEYGLIIAVVAVMLIGALVTLKDDIANIFNGVNTELTNQTSGS